VSRGTLPLKVRIPGCEPIRRLSGTTDPKVLKRLVAMVHTMHEQGRDDLVNAIARGRLKPLQVYTRFRFTRLDELPHADELPRFADEWPRWIAALECSEDHRTSCGVWCRRIASLLGTDAPITELPRALKDFRGQSRLHPRSFNLARTTLMAFLRDVVGQRHRLWNDVAEIPLLKVKPTRRKHPLTPDQLRDLVKRMGEPCGPMAWTMATTGMGWREYTGEWEREGEGLRIHGTKTQGRDRLIPLVSLLHQPEGTIYRFRWQLTRASEGSVTPYDLRRTFANLMVEAGIPRPRRMTYMGHGARDILDLYEWSEVKEYLRKDGERMRVVLGEPPGGPTLQMVRAW
jgi:integrase